MNVSPMQTWRIIHDLGIVYKRPKLELEKGIDYEEKKNKIDRYKKVSSALFKKDSTGIWRWNMVTSATIHNKNIYEKKRRTAKDTP